MSFWRFVLLAGVCGWGLPVAVLFSVLFWLSSDPRPVFWELFFVSLVGFSLGGVVVGALWWLEGVSRVERGGQPFTFQSGLPASEQGESGPPLRILFESIGWESDEPVREMIDLSREFNFLFMMFGSGNYIEARAVGETPEAIAAFRRLVTLGGFAPATGAPPPNARLYRPGDEMYPAQGPFVFICPTPDPALVNGPPAESPRTADDAGAFI